MSMLYRPFGNTGEMVSALGFGAMRLPVLDDRPENIDVGLATKMLDYALGHGVNYIDTGYFYHSSDMGRAGRSEPFLGDYLSGGLRDKVLLTTKLPLPLIKSRSDMDRVLADQLQRLRTDHFDFYLLHGVNGIEWARIKDMGVFDFLDEARARGDIRFAGFSFHDEFPLFVTVADAYDWDMCQIQYNYMDTEFQAGRAGLEYAASRGLAVAVMGPAKGGRLAGKMPDEVEAILDDAPQKWSPAEWAFRWVWDHKEVGLALSGMSTLEQVVENVRMAGEAYPASLGRAELETIDRVKKAYEKRQFVACTGCNYCMPCPNGLNIPLIFSFRNNAALYDDVAGEVHAYTAFSTLGSTAPATDCTECALCESACPQNIEITKMMAECADFFAANAHLLEGATDPSLVDGPPGSKDQL
jgi:uncharacterized protein